LVERIAIESVRAISFETLAWFSPGAMQFLCEATHAAFPQPGHQPAVCFANVYHQLSVVSMSAVRTLTMFLLAALFSQVNSNSLRLGC
jgi:hypothetical protein